MAQAQGWNSLHHQFLIHAGLSPLMTCPSAIETLRPSSTMKLLSLPVQHPSFVHRNLCSTTTFSTIVVVDQKHFSRRSSPLVEPKIKRTRGIQRLPVAAAAAELAVAETPEEISDVVRVEEPQKLVKDARSIGKPRLVLKFIWMDKNIGIGLDQVLPRHGTVPLSPYFFWPRKDAWEELKATLESKPWISQKKMIILLNQATDIINLWQQSGGNLS